MRLFTAVTMLAVFAGLSMAACGDDEPPPER